jgi:hypothetical protein
MVLKCESPATEGSTSHIPKISDAELDRLGATIKPVMRGRDIPNIRLATFLEDVSVWKKLGANNKLFWVEDADAKCATFMWSPVPKSIASDLKKMCCITTYHTFGYYSFFKPTTAEVIAQIPEGLRARVVAFETVPISKDVNELLTPDKKYHIAKTTLYESRSRSARRFLRREKDKADAGEET